MHSDVCTKAQLMHSDVCTEAQLKHSDVCTIAQLMRSESELQMFVHAHLVMDTAGF